jgi:hypothetical protein
MATKSQLFNSDPDVAEELTNLIKYVVVSP